MASAEVEAKQLPDDVLPTELQIFQHYLHLRKVKTESGEWHTKVSMATRAKALMPDIAAVWSNFGIPHHLSGRKGEQRVERLLSRFQDFMKNINKKNDDEIVANFGKLFDIARCSCSIDCTCALDDQVPPSLKEFLKDQRGERKISGRKLSLRGATAGLELDRKRRAEMDLTLLRKEELLAKKQKQEEKNEMELEEQFKTVKLEDIEIDSESDWEDEPDDESQEEDSDGEGGEKEKEKRNTTSLEPLAMGCDMVKVSDSVGAFLGTCALIAHGLITKEDPSLIIDPSKLRRARLKFGQKTASSRRVLAKKLPGLYTDGKRSATLVRKTKTTKVATGKVGRGAYREVSSTSNEVEVQDHFPILAMPGAHFVTHVTPADGKGNTLAKELEAVVREEDMPIKVIGMDGCPTNTGPHTGAIRILELLLFVTLQWVICGLHLNELLFWHILTAVDGPTASDKKLTGPVGSRLDGNLWEENVVKFAAIPGKVPTLPPEVVKKLSRDQYLAYLYCHAVQSGVMPKELATMTIGPLVKSRWLTTGIRILCLYTRTKRPSKGLIRLVKVLLNLYFPGWFRYRHHSHIQDGSKNFHYLIELVSDLPEAEDRETAHVVLNRNSFWAHPENIVISMMGDEDKEVRREAVNWVKRARQEFDPANHPRQFFPPTVDFTATSYTKMVDWEQMECTEPPLTRDMSEAELDEVVEKAYKFEDFPNHTQQVEAAVRVVHETATRRASHRARDNLIHQLLEGRGKCSKFKTKRDGLGMLD